MAIVITVDNADELLWMDEIISCGCLNVDHAWFLKNELPLSMNCTYKKSENYINNRSNREITVNE